ncbi:hypothetical protein BGX38DRAFT_1260884 [Terfezia claveryi]|nr:hypothetical protein BGX38DRAFT_1260884 [Terfezia claveryi]
MLHAAALSRHAFEKKQPQEPKKKQRSTLTATLKEAFSPSPSPFSYNTTPSLQPPRGSKGAPGVDIEGSSARVDPSNKFSTIIPDYAYLQQPTIEPRAYEVYQRHKVTKRRKRLGCFSCTRRLSTSSSDGGAYSRPANLAASTKYGNTQSPKPVLQTYGHDDSNSEIIVDARRPIVPTMSPKAALAKPALVQHSSLKHPQPRPGGVVMPKTPRESPRIGQRPQLQAKDVEDNTDTDTYSSELIPSSALCTRESSGVPAGRTPANSRTIWCEQEEFLNLEKISVREAVSPPKTKRSAMYSGGECALANCQQS